MVLAFALVLAPVSGGALAAPALADETGSTEPQFDPGQLPPVQPPLVDQNVVFLFCASGASLGALLTGLPPVIGWIPYSGWPTQLGSLTLRMGLGCYYGLIAGVATSGTYSIAHRAGDWFGRLF